MISEEIIFLDNICSHCRDIIFITASLSEKIKVNTYMWTGFLIYIYIYIYIYVYHISIKHTVEFCCLQPWHVQTNTDRLTGAEKKGRDAERDNDREGVCEPSALCDVLNANCLTWFSARGLFRTKDSSPGL